MATLCRSAATIDEPYRRAKAVGAAHAESKWCPYAVVRPCRAAEVATTKFIRICASGSHAEARRAH
jgi:hypothetical protein